MRLRIAALLLCSVLGAACAKPAAAAVATSDSFPAVAAVQPPPLDADAPAWAPGAMPLGGGFWNLTTRAKAPHATQVWMLYDSHNIYVAFKAEQRGTPIVASQTTNDVGFGLDDFVGVGLDPSGVGTQVYYFETTPRGIRYEQAAENARYRPTWTAKASISGGSWSAVLIIPLSVLRIHGGSPQTWRINFIRNVAASAEHYTWSYNGIMQDGAVGNGWPNFVDVRYWAAWRGLVFGKGAPIARPKPRAEVYLLDSAGRDRNVFQQGDGLFLPQNVRMVGIDTSVPLTNTINFVGTLNPDFSNVEVDQQTIAPQEFRRFLQEYRPFFAQGANFINANGDPFNANQIFYSPGVGPFDRGAKIEGTFGDQSFGVLNFRGFDEVTGNTFDDTAFGYKHALQDRTFQYWTDGVLAHHSIFGDDAALEFGAGGRNLNNGFVWAFDHAFERGSWVPTGIAHSSNAFADVHKPNYEIFTGYQDITPFYDPIDGFTQISDVRGPLVSFNTNGVTPGMKNFSFFAQADRFIDNSGAVHQADFDAFLSATFHNGFSINGIGPTIGELRSYSVVDPKSQNTTCSDPALPRSYFTGYPSYFCGRTDTFNLFGIPIGYGDGTPSPIDVSVNFGKFGFGAVGPNDNGPDYLHLYTISTSRTIGRRYSVGLEYDGSFERALSTGAFDSQWLRRISIGTQFGPDENFTISLRGINGTGGFAAPGLNLAAAYHKRFRNGDEIFLNYGTPAAPYTLQRFIVKYLFHFGAEAGT